MHSVANELGSEICSILLSFHALTGSDYTNPFFNRTKMTSFRKMLKIPSSYKLLNSLATENVNVSDVTKFILNIIYNRPLKERTPGESRYKMLLTRRKTGKEKKYPSSKALPPDQKSLTMKILRASFVSHCMVNCLDREYIPPNPSEYGWKLVDSTWEPVWFEGNALPDANETNVSSEEDDSENEDESMESMDDISDSDDSDYVTSDNTSSDSDF